MIKASFGMATPVEMSNIKFVLVLGSREVRLALMIGKGLGVVILKVMFVSYSSICSCVLFQVSYVVSLNNPVSSVVYGY